MRVYQALLLLLSRFSRVQLCATLQMEAHQAPPSLGFSRILAGESQGWGNLVGCRLWGRTESDTTEATQQQQQCHNKYPKACVCIPLFLIKLTFIPYCSNLDIQDGGGCSCRKYVFNFTYTYIYSDLNFFPIQVITRVLNSLGIPRFLLTISFIWNDIC